MIDETEFKIQGRRPCRKRAISSSLSEGRLIPEAIYAELGEIVLLRKPGKTGDEEIIVFKSVGLATEDLAATAAY